MAKLSWLLHPFSPAYRIEETQGPPELRTLSPSAAAVALRTGLLCAGEASAASAPCALSAAALSESAAASLLLSLEPFGGLVNAEALLAARAVGTRISALTVVP